MNFISKLIYYLPAIPFIGIFFMIIYPALNDEAADMLCIRESELTVCCFLIQVASMLVLLIELNIIEP